MACIPHQHGGTGGSCNLKISAIPTTTPLARPDVSFVRSPFMGGSATIDGRRVPVWGFNDGYGALQSGPFPSPMIRVRQGQIVHTTLYSLTMPHTIHHHGIEPAQIFDGVGHTSRDVLNTYTYQWRPHQAGTYMYHCHTNTVVHVEMGMYGALIVDPPSGPGLASDGVTRYDAEAIWVADDLDTAWHCLDWDAALCGGDAGLNEFNPDLFCMSGKGQAELDADADSAAPVVAATVRRGGTLLLRYIVASYLPQRVRFDPRLGEALVIAEDGRVLPGVQSLGAGGALLAASGERFEIVLRPQVAGRRIPVLIEWSDYRAVSGAPRVVGRLTAYVNVI
jgi:FtsP/CotA-like multicopper oxidase with cupredoxin domain